MNFQPTFNFLQSPGIKNQYDFNGGDLSSDGGLLLLREFDEESGFTEDLSRYIVDDRNSESVTHQIIEMLRYRMYTITAGYEDCNDVKYLKTDPAIQSIIKENLPSQPTLSRFENSVGWKDIKRIREWSVERWLDGFEFTPDEIILDIDSTDDPCHGHQQLALFHGYYRQYMYHPLIISCNGQIILSVLRGGRSHAARWSVSFLKFIISRIRKRFDSVRIIVRADSGFSSPLMYSWLEKNGIGYVIGTARNKILEALNQPLMSVAKLNFESQKVTQRLFHQFQYQAGSWNTSRKVIGKAEYLEKGANNRFVTTNLEGTPENVYQFYCQRGNSENWIKILKENFHADRLSCRTFLANQFRLLLSTLSFRLLGEMQMVAFKDTPLENASISVIVLQLFKLAVRVIQTTRTKWFHFCSSAPCREYFNTIHQNILRYQT